MREVKRSKVTEIWEIAVTCCIANMWRNLPPAIQTGQKD
jgi:hypothetical protein